MFDWLFNLLFPPSVHEKVLHNVDTLTPEPCTVKTPSGKSVLTCLSYKHPHVKSAIKLLKRYPNEHAAHLLASVLADVLTEELSDTALWEGKEIAIVPIPLSKERLRERGFNQTELICNFLPENARSHVRTSILARTKHTPMQKTLKRSERLTNVTGVFSTNEELRPNMHYIVIDDVTTTGATLDAAAHVFKEQGANVSLVAIARV